MGLKRQHDTEAGFGVVVFSNIHNQGRDMSLFLSNDRNREWFDLFANGKHIKSYPVKLHKGTGYKPPYISPKRILMAAIERSVMAERMRQAIVNDAIGLLEALEERSFVKTLIRKHMTYPDADWEVRMGRAFKLLRSI